MPVNSTHPQYDASVESWRRIRDVLAGDAAINPGGEKYVVRLDLQTDQQHQANVRRSFFYNLTALTGSLFLCRALDLCRSVCNCAGAGLKPFV